MIRAKSLPEDAEETTDQENMDFEKAINSIPAYVECANYFVIVAPTIRTSICLSLGQVFAEVC